MSRRNDATSSLPFEIMSLYIASASSSRQCPIVSANIYNMFIYGTDETSGKRRTSQLITIRNHVSGVDAASLGFGVASTQQRFERVNLSGRGAAGGGRRQTSFSL